HDAADVVTALGTGSGLTALATQASIDALNDLDATAVQTAAEAALAEYGASVLTTADIPTAAEISSQTNSDLTDAHGDGSYLTATSVAVSDKTGFKLASDGLR